MFRRTLLLGALASVALFMAGTNARADYSFAASAITTSGTFQPSLTDVVAANNQTHSGDTPPAATTFLTVTYSGIPGTAATTLTGLQTISWTETLSSTTTGQVAAFALSAVLSISATNNQVSVTATTSTPTAGPTNGFSLSTFAYTPGANSSFNPGAIGFTVTAPVAQGVPEPASVVMLGSGLVGVVGLGLVRKKRKVAQPA